MSAFRFGCDDLLMRIAAMERGLANRRLYSTRVERSTIYTGADWGLSFIGTRNKKGEPTLAASPF